MFPSTLLACYRYMLKTLLIAIIVFIFPLKLLATVVTMTGETRICGKSQCFTRIHIYDKSDFTASVCFKIYKNNGNPNLKPRPRYCQYFGKDQRGFFIASFIPPAPEMSNQVKTKKRDQYSLFMTNKNCKVFYNVNKFFFRN